MAYNEKETQILPEELSSNLKGALIELTFTLRHYRIKNASQDYDTYTGTIEQIIILERAPPKKVSPYRSGDGPVRIRPSNVPSRAEQAAAVRAFSWSRPTLRTPPPAVQATGSSINISATIDLTTIDASPSLHTVKGPQSETSDDPVAVAVGHVPSSGNTISPTPAPDQTTPILPTTLPNLPAVPPTIDSPVTSSAPLPERHETLSPTNNPVPPPDAPATQNIRGHQTLIIPSKKALGKRKADEAVDDEQPRKKSSK